MINISGMSQIEIEELSSRESIKEAMQILSAEFYNLIREEDLTGIEKIIPIDFRDDILLEMLFILGDENTGSPEKLTSKIRLIEPKALITLVAGTKTLSNLYGEDRKELFIKATEIVLFFEDILYDINIRTKHIGDNQFREVVYCELGFTFDTSFAEVPKWEYFKLPLIEKPNEWTTYNNGGYHTSNAKCTLNLGEAKQPQKVLNILNKLQNQKYLLHPKTNIDHYYTYKLNKAHKKNNGIEDDYEIDKKVRNTLTSFSDTIETMKDKKFYFEWKFDFRGRMYNTAYNIALQGDSYQKGMVIPDKTNFK